MNTLIESIKEIIKYEPSEESKLNLLTEIGLTSKHEGTFKACEEIRSQLCNGAEASAHPEQGQSKSVENRHPREEVGNVLLSGVRAPVHGETSTRNKLDTLLKKINVRAQKTFEFEGTTFPTKLVKAFIYECRHIPDLEVAVFKAYMSLTWPNGYAEIHSHDLSEHIKAEAKKEVLK